VNLLEDKVGIVRISMLRAPMPLNDAFADRGNKNKDSICGAESVLTFASVTSCHLADSVAHATRVGASAILFPTREVLIYQ
jgi:hypothetical protein